MNIVTKLSGGALFAALLYGSSGVAAHAQNALTNVSSQAMSEATVIRVGCGIGAPVFIEAVNQAEVATNGNLFTMPTMVGLLAGLAVVAIGVSILPPEHRSKCVKTIKKSLKVLFHLNTACCAASVAGAGYLDLFALIVLPFMMAISWWLAKDFRREFWQAMCLRPAPFFFKPEETTEERIDNAVRRVAPRRIATRRVADALPVQQATALGVSLSTQPIAVAAQVSDDALEETACDVQMSEQQLDDIRAALNRQFHRDVIPDFNRVQDGTVTSEREVNELLCHSR